MLLRLSNRHHLLIRMALLLILSHSAYAEDPRIKEELADKLAVAPLIKAIGADELERYLASGNYVYVGNTKCRLCHREFFVGRKKDAHDHTLEKLDKLGYADNPRCLVCHSTGYGIPGGFVSIKDTPRLANVQCEGCHGPGSVHVVRRDKGGFLAGTDKPELLRKMCISCHTERWDQSYNELDKAFKKYRNPIPK